MMKTALWRMRIQPVIRLASSVLLIVFLWGRLLPSRVHSVGPPSGKDRIFGFWAESGSGVSFRSRQLLGSEEGSSGSAGVGARGRFIEAQQAAGPGFVLSLEGGVPAENIIGNNDTANFLEAVSCQDAYSHPGFNDSCFFVTANANCKSGTVIDYTTFFFCRFAGFPVLGYVVFAVWLMALFYMLGNTAADYFCCSVERLAKALRLPPTLAGVTLVPFGNGAPDVFASIAAFMGAGAGEVGLNSVLGGAFFVSSVVAGSVSLAVATSECASHLHRRSFVRDILFFLFTVAALACILAVGRIYLWGAIAYLCIYLLYGFAVAFVEWRKKVSKKKFINSQALQPALQPLLTAQTSLPQWRWAPHIALFAHLGHLPHPPRPLWGWSEDDDEIVWYTPRGLCWYLIEWPLALPRRLTIPVVEPDRWSRPFAVASATLAPLLFALVWDSKDNEPFMSSWEVYVGGSVVGACLGVTAFFTTVAEHPPRSFVFPWVFGGFLMSIMWFYVIANELVATLVALGVILQIDASILGLTVLAWGNSVGDLMSNLALAVSGTDGVQIAIAGCYAGPMFNTLIGIGLSFALASWKTYPASFTVPSDPSLFYTLGFLVAGLLWSLLLLPQRGMHPSKTLGCGLLFIYGSFLCLRLAVIFRLVEIW